MSAPEDSDDDGDMSPGSGSSVSGSRLRVLVVDDQPDIRMMCRVNLALEGYEVLEAADGESGLIAARSIRPDLILLDVMMPGMDGWEVLGALKASPVTSRIPIVMLTARVQREDEIRGLAAGAVGYVPKPFNPATLSEVIRRILTEDAEEHRKRALAKLSIL